ncbi:MAG: DsrE family protein [Rhodocyclaceae bacterium]|nr:DsrE family protein [Rhodocyclaceae bacterium]MDZ4216590.1 DsrE family protein [Rhodocyclaceae bacterium]
MHNEISDEILNAYIDNELDTAERARLLERLTADTTLGGRACELWQLKQMLRGAYPLPHEKSALAGRRFAPPRWTQALAASLLLLLGAASGWLVHERVESQGVSMRQLDAIRHDGGRVVLHLFSDEPARMEAALRMAEQLAQAQDQAGKPLRVEFVANGPGLHLLRVGGSPYADRVAHLKQYSNLRLVACHEAMQRLQDRGLDVTLLPSVEIAPSAEGELAARLTQGWRYIQA